MSANNEPTLLDMIESLLRGKVGDIPRLENIRLKLADGKTIYESDKTYVRSTFQDHHGRSIHADSIKHENLISTKPRNQSSRAWYLLPIFLWFLGGVISYACLRKEHPSHARKSLILGIGLSVPAVAVLVIAGLGGSDGDVVSSSTETIDLSHDEIKRDAPSIQSEPLKSDPGQSVLGQQTNGDPDNAGIQPREKSFHTVSYQDIPEYVDQQTVRAALHDAIREWEGANLGLDFEITDHGADLDLYWARWMPGSQLGQYVARTTTDNVSTMHRINIRLGSDDCHSEYQQYSLESLRHTIAHEIGHYLGLRHIDDKTHVMYSGELFDVDSASTYDDHGYNTPELAKPAVISDKGKSILSQIDMVHDEIGGVLLERQAIKSAHGEESRSVWESALQDNTDVHNALVMELNELEKELDCLDNSRF